MSRKKHESNFEYFLFCWNLSKILYLKALSVKWQKLWAKNSESLAFFNKFQTCWHQYLKLYHPKLTGWQAMQIKLPGMDYFQSEFPVDSCRLLYTHVREWLEFCTERTRSAISSFTSLHHGEIVFIILLHHNVISCACSQQRVTQIHFTPIMKNHSKSLRLKLIKFLSVSSF